MTTLNLIPSQIILHYITLTDYYIVKRHILLTSNHSNINLEINKNNRVNKTIILNLIHLQIIQHYITLKIYYIAKDTLRSQVTTAI